MENNADRDWMAWGNLPRTPAARWWRFVAGAGLPVGALNLRGLPVFDLGSFGLLVPLGLLDLGFLDLRALEALHLRFPGGSLCHASDPEAQCQGERQCTKSHICIIACLRRTTNTSLENSPL